MPLADTYVQTYGQLPEVFKRLSEGQAPEKFTRQHLKDLGFASSNFHAVLPLLKSLGFLTADGAPTQRYHDYRNHSQSRTVLGQAMKEAYADLFVIKSHPSVADRQLIEGKFKSAHNTSERVAQLMASTFFSLLSIADVNASNAKPTAPSTPESAAQTPTVAVSAPALKETTLSIPSHRPGLHYNIQIHLPATKDIEVFNAIFKSLREHLLD